MFTQTLLLLSLVMLVSADLLGHLQVPEPAGGTALLCGLLVIAYMARRRTRWPEG